MSTTNGTSLKLSHHEDWQKCLHLVFERIQSWELVTSYIGGTELPSLVGQTLVSIGGFTVTVLLW